MTTLALQFDSYVGAGLEPIGFEFHERLNELYELDVIVQSLDPNLDFETFFGRGVRATLPAPAKSDASGNVVGPVPLEVSGIVHRIEQVSTEPTGVSRYRLIIVPHLFLLTLRRNCRVFRERMALAIVRKLLEDYEGNVFPFEYVAPGSAITSNPESRRVQYGETDYEFVRWVLADAGFTFCFKSGWTVFGDTTTKTDAMLPTISFVPPSLDSPKKGHASAVHLASELRTSAAAVRYYSDLSPDLKPMKTSVAETPPFPHKPERERYDYETRSLPDAVERRLDAERATRRVVRLTTNFPYSPGEKLVLEGHPREDANGELLVIACRGSGDAISAQYELDCIDSSTAFRPVRLSPPRIIGTQTAVVSSYEDNADFATQVKIRFQWQRPEHPAEVEARVSQAWAGPRYGLFCHPRIGDEVIVEFLDGDPSQPIIVGRVHNAKNPPPLELPKDRAISIWKSHEFPAGAGFNHILLDDNTNKMRLELHAHNDFRCDTGSNSVTTVGKNSSNKITGGYQLSAGSTAIATGAFTLNADEVTLSASGYRTDQSHTHRIRATIIDSLAQEKVSLQSIDRIEIFGEGGLELACGESKLTLTKTGIVLKAESITIEGTEGAVDVKGLPIKLNCT